MASSDSDSTAPTSDGPPPTPAAPPRQNRAAGIAFATVAVLALTVVIGAVLVRSRPVPVAPCVPSKIVNIAGGMGFFSDAEVKDILCRNGFGVTLAPKGSRELPRIDFSQYQAVISTSPAALAEIRNKRGGDQVFPITSSPLVIVTTPEVAQALSRGGLARPDPDNEGTWIFDVRKYVEGVLDKVKWNEIPGNTTFPSKNMVMVMTSNPEISSTPEAFVAVISQAFNETGGELTASRVGEFAGKVVACFEQGQYKDKTPDVMRDFLTAARGQVPMALVYENDYLAAKIAYQDSPGKDPRDVRKDMVVMYPERTISSDNVLLALDDGHGPGSQLAGLIGTVPRLRVILEQRYGYRSVNNQHSLEDFMTGRGIPITTDTISWMTRPKYTFSLGLLDAVKASESKG